MVLRMGELIPAFARGAVLFQDPIHGPRRAKILAFIEQRGVDRGRRAILEALGIQDGANGLDLHGAQCPGAVGDLLRGRGIKRCAGHSPTPAKID